MQFLDSLGHRRARRARRRTSRSTCSSAPDLIAALPGVYTGFLLASIPLWVFASRRFGKRQAWIAAMIGMALSFGVTIFVGENDVTLILGMLVLAGLFGGCGGPIGASMLADVIDADELATGERKEGAYTAAFTFAFQVGSGITVAVVGFALVALGLRAERRSDAGRGLDHEGAVRRHAARHAADRGATCCAATRSTSASTSASAAGCSTPAARRLR